MHTADYIETATRWLDEAVKWLTSATWVEENIWIVFASVVISLMTTNTKVGRAVRRMVRFGVTKFIPVSFILYYTQDMMGGGFKEYVDFIKIYRTYIYIMSIAILLVTTLVESFYR